MVVLFPAVLAVVGSDFLLTTAARRRHEQRRDDENDHTDTHGGTSGTHLKLTGWSSATVVTSRSNPSDAAGSSGVLAIARMLMRL